MPVPNQGLPGAPPLRVWLLTLLILLLIGIILGALALTVRDAWLYLS